MNAITNRNCTNFNTCAALQASAPTLNHSCQSSILAWAPRGASCTSTSPCERRKIRAVSCVDRRPCHWTCDAFDGREPIQWRCSEWRWFERTTASTASVKSLWSFCAPIADERRMKCQMIPWWGKWMLEIAQLLTTKETLINELTNYNRWMFHWHEKHVKRCVVQEDEDANVSPDQISFEVKAFQELWVFELISCWEALSW